MEFRQNRFLRFRATPHDEPFDFRIESISAPERNRARHHEAPQLYAWFVKS